MTRTGKNIYQSKLWGLFLLGALLVLAQAGPAQALFGGCKEKDIEAIAVTFNQEVGRGGYRVISTTGLKKWLDAKKDMLLVDTMPYDASYKKNHIPGAKQFLFPIPEMEKIDEEVKGKFLKLLGPDKERLLIFYCGFTKCTRSHNGAMWAAKLGYKNVFRCPGGIVGWKDHDFPVAQAK